MDKFVYPSLKSRLKAEYKIYLLALLFILIADSIGQIQIPLGLGQFILFPIFYALIMGVLSGPQALKIVKTKEVKAASKLVIVAITDVYGPDSPEARGSLSIYVVGGMIGTIYFGFMVSVIAMLNIFHPYALGMASGVGAGILMASAVASLTAIYPTMADQISALASASETISGIDGIYMALLIGLPLCNVLYNFLEPRIGRLGEKRKKKGEKES